MALNSDRLTSLPPIFNKTGSFYCALTVNPEIANTNTGIIFLILLYFIIDGIAIYLLE